MILSEERHADGLFASYTPYRATSCKLSVFFIECRRCGFEPDNQTSLPSQACPKCHSDTCRRVLRPRSLLQGKIGRRYRVTPQV